MSRDPHDSDAVVSSDAIDGRVGEFLIRGGGHESFEILPTFDGQGFHLDIFLRWKPAHAGVAVKRQEIQTHALPQHM